MLRSRLLKYRILIPFGFILFFQGCEDIQLGNNFVKGLRSGQRHEAFKRASPPSPPFEINKTHTLISLKGPGSFISAQAWIQGNTDGNSYVQLKLDEKIVVGFSFKRGKSLGYEQGNLYGLAAFPSKVPADSTLVITIGFNTPLYYQDSLLLKIRIRDTRITKMDAEIMFASEWTPDEPPTRPDAGGETPD